MCFPSPSEDFFKEYKMIIMKFLWGEGCHSIRYDKLIQPYQKGGLGLVDLKTKDTSMKVTFVNRARANLQSPIYYNLPEKNQDIWRCNLHWSDF